MTLEQLYSGTRSNTCDVFTGLSMKTLLVNLTYQTDQSSLNLVFGVCCLFFAAAAAAGVVVVVVLLLLLLPVPVVVFVAVVLRRVLVMVCVIIAIVDVALRRCHSPCFCTAKA